MKKITIFLITIISALSLNAQVTDFLKPLSIEYSFGLERVGYNNYESYEKDGSNLDSNFSILSKNGNAYSLGLKTSLELSKKHTVFSGLNIRVLDIESELLSGWTDKVLDRKRRVIPSFEIDFGHRYQILKASKYKFFLENNIDMSFSDEMSEFNLKKVSVLWRTGLHIERSVSDELTIFTGVNYGIGILDSSLNDRYVLRANALGLTIGFKKPL